MLWQNLPANIRFWLAEELNEELYEWEKNHLWQLGSLAVDRNALIETLKRLYDTGF